MSAAVNLTKAQEVTFAFVMGSLSLFGYVYSAVLIVFNIKYRNLRFVKMTSPRINIIIICGGIVIYTYSALVSVSPLLSQWQQRHHQGEFWLLTIGFTLLVGSMLVKGWRVYQLFSYQKKKKKLIKDGNLVVGLLIFLVLDISFMLCWQLSDPVTCSTHTSVCTSSDQSTWLLALGIYKQCFVLTCCFVGWAIRHVTFPALDDGRSLLLTAVFTLLSVGTVSILSALYPQFPQLPLYTSSVFSWLTTTVALSAAFFHKIYVIYHNKGKEPYMNSASKYIQVPMSNDAGEELLKVLGENHYLKQRLDEKDTMISQLKKIVPSSLHADVEGQQMSHPNSSCVTHTSANSAEESKGHVHHWLSLCCATPTTEEYKSEGLEEHKKYHNTERLVSLSTARHHSHCSRGPSRIPGRHIVGSPMHTRAILPPSSESNRSVTWDYGYDMNIDLICSIADTYELPSDSDTYSYISNCLIQKSYESNNSDSAARKLRRSQGNLLNERQGLEQKVASGTGNSEVSSSNKPRRYRRKRSRSQPAPSRHSRYQTTEHPNSAVMTDSNCSTIIL